MNSWGAIKRFCRIYRLASYEVAVLILLLLASVPFAAPETRPVCCAGQQYPAQQSELYSQIEAFIKVAPPSPDFDRLSAIFVPDAPYIYVGSFLGRAYSGIIGKRFDHIVILGADPTATAPTIYSGAKFVTPLGPILSDDALADELIQKCPVKFESVLPKYPLPSSIEAQLPFIQYIYGKYPVLAIGLYDQTSEEAASIGHALAGILDDGCSLIIGVVNLSESYDSRSCDGIDRLLLDRLRCLSIDKMCIEFEQGRIQAASPAVIVAAMVASIDMGANHVEIMRYAHSGGISGDQQSVVGYMASMVGIEDGATGRREICIAEEDEAFYLDIARREIERYLGVNNSPKRSESSRTRGSHFPDGVYITVYMNDKLRGGMTSLFPTKPLFETISKLAVSAAFNDPRFNPITIDELDDITIKIHIMTNASMIDSPWDFDPSKDAFFIKRGSYSAMILPGELNPALGNEEILGRACLKAGMLSNCWRQSETSVWSFDIHEFGEGH